MSVPCRQRFNCRRSTSRASKSATGTSRPMSTTMPGCGVGRDGKTFPRTRRPVPGHVPICARWAAATRPTKAMCATIQVGRGKAINVSTRTWPAAATWPVQEVATRSVAARSRPAGQAPVAASGPVPAMLSARPAWALRLRRMPDRGTPDRVTRDRGKRNRGAQARRPRQPVQRRPARGAAGLMCHRPEQASPMPLQCRARHRQAPVRLPASKARSPARRRVELVSIENK